ncbi:MAG: SpoIIE family protein phosphatase [Planctomycetes bacterium]|nr:SpoIIE family protein phosphatase [Planctomycetota bacterium]MCH9726645.1 SpoIIE family protein phosphatase [Planctomycetota bacterium]MCH9779553.1 SpoIIE family protein phosphatase [Planctomycetota bacterium]MCH9791698.1 SpoIIE family protein phosphatase [Planctomycetota bacterium]
MAILQILKGKIPDQIIELSGDRVIMGRHPNCEIVLDNVAVSRYHAQILESHGFYYLEDLHSRNGTLLNGTVIEGRTELHENDTISICDIQMQFLLDYETPPDFLDSAIQQALEVSDHSLKKESHVVALGESSDEGVLDGSSIISQLDLNTSSHLRISVKPEVKLHAVLEISQILSRALKLDEVLPRILDGLFKIFAQADQGFIMLQSPERKKLVVKATKARRKEDEESIRISTTIVRQTIMSGAAILSADAVEDDRFKMSESISSLRIRSMMCVPLVSQGGDVLGVIQIATRDIGQQFDKDDLDVLVAIAQQSSLALENAKLHEELVKQRDIERDLEFAHQIQLGLLPHNRPKFEEYEFFDYYESAQSVGGDYFDYIKLPDGKLVITLGDVAGKGVPAAILMARLYASARYQVLSKSSPDIALAKLNLEIASSGVGLRFITFLMAVLDPKKHTVSLVNAGHMAPLLRNSADGTVESVAQELSGMPLGVLKDQVFHVETFSLDKGDTLVFYTDGVTEAMDQEKNLYHRDRLVKFIKSGPEEVEPLVKGILSDVDAFRQNALQTDDICVVSFRRKK